MEDATMSGRKRKGMVIKNTDDKTVNLTLDTRSLSIKPGEEEPITADEVRDAALRESLQVRAISIVRPCTEQEEEQLRQMMEEDQ